MAGLVDPTSRAGKEFASPIARFLELSPQQQHELAQSAPAACQGNTVNVVEALERCIEAICANRGKATPNRLWQDRPPFFDAIRANRNAIVPLTPQAQIAFRHYVAQSRADVYCPKDPPNDGNRAVVTDPFRVPAIDQPPLAVAFLGLAALAAVRLASLVRPELRPAAPGLIQGIYLWMGLTPPAENMMPRYNRYTDA